MTGMKDGDLIIGAAVSQERGHEEESSNNEEEISQGTGDPKRQAEVGKTEEGQESTLLRDGKKPEELLGIEKGVGQGTGRETASEMEDGEVFRVRHLQVVTDPGEDPKAEKQVSGNTVQEGPHQDSRVVDTGVRVQEKKDTAPDLTLEGKTGVVTGPDFQLRQDNSKPVCAAEVASTWQNFVLGTEEERKNLVTTAGRQRV